MASSSSSRQGSTRPTNAGPSTSRPARAQHSDSDGDLPQDGRMDIDSDDVDDDDDVKVIRKARKSPSKPVAILTSEEEDELQSPISKETTPPTPAPKAVDKGKKRARTPSDLPSDWPDSDDEPIAKKPAKKTAASIARDAARSIIAETTGGQPKGKGKAKAAPKPKPSAKAKGKGKAVGKGGKLTPFAGTGNRLGGPVSGEEDADSSELSEVEGSGDELHSSTDDEDTSAAATPSGSVKGKGRARAPRVKKPKLSQYEKTLKKLEKHHPELRTTWTLLKGLPKIKPEKSAQPDGLTLKLLPFQLEGLNWLLKQEAGPWKGGILADEMGMGKTVQTISLLLTDFDASASAKKRKHTLVVAPTVAIVQWRNEIAKYTDVFKVYLWHGQQRQTDVKELKKYDIILTSYSVLESSFRREHKGFTRDKQLCKEPSALHQINWHRVVLDEAHNIKDRGSNTARAAFALDAKFRWCLSGTPLQNRVGELYSMVRFLGADPFAYAFCKACDCKSLHWEFKDRAHCDQCGHSPMQHTWLWNQAILKPIQHYGNSSFGVGAFEKLHDLLARLMLRRTKVERADDLGLPPRTVTVRRDFFTEEEEELYNSLFREVERKFNSYVAHGTVLNNYGNLFQLITRMRQMALHPDLVLRGKMSTILPESQQLSLLTCRVCLDEAEDAIMSKCRHVYCRLCAQELVEMTETPECVVCHLSLEIDLEAPAIEGDQEKAKKGRQGMLDRIDPTKWRSSTKIEALVEELTRLRSEDHTIKSLVFSQFTSFLDLVARRLQLAGFNIVRLQGTMTPEARNRTIQHFTSRQECTVFLLSLKAGGVALNLIEASRVFVMDPWWNPAVELQAYDRAHRIGQHRPVEITRLIIEDSIESKIVQLQAKKMNMARRFKVTVRIAELPQTSAALGDDNDALGRLTPEDMRFLFTL